MTDVGSVAICLQVQCGSERKPEAALAYYSVRPGLHAIVIGTVIGLPPRCFFNHAVFREKPLF